MKGDFSRFTFVPVKRYTSVLMQQGRVALDSDWNEKAAIVERVGRIRFVDTVGDSAALTCDGFALRARDGALELSPGRLYVGGLLCELDAVAPLEQLTTSPPPPEPGRTDLVYVEAWERQVTALQDPDLLEPALGGADTTTRLQVAWRLGVVANIRDGAEDLAELLPRAPTGTMSVAGGAYTGAENQLYRVEIQDGGDLCDATFKWSRDNGSVVFSVEELRGPQTFAVAPFPRTASHALEVGDWVEVIGDESERDSRVGTLARVEQIPEADVVVLDSDVSAQASERHALLRRWDGGHAAPLPTQDVELEDGVSIRFDGGGFRAGDYWTIAARPGVSFGRRDEQPPEGVERCMCALAVVTWPRYGDDVKPQVSDRRRVFAPLTELSEEVARLRAEVAELRRRLDGEQEVML